MTNDENSGCLGSFIAWGGILNAGVIGYHHGASAPLLKESEPWMLIGIPIVYGMYTFFMDDKKYDNTVGRSGKKALVATADMGILEAIVYGISYGIGSLTK